MPTLEFVKVFDYNSVGGNIRKSGLTYTVTLGVYDTSFNSATGAAKRAFWQFDTSSLGAQATVTKVEMRFQKADSQTPPLAESLMVYIGNFIGASLGSTDWNGGEATGQDILFFGWNTWFDLSTPGVFDATEWVHTGQTTDIKVKTLETVNANYLFENRILTQMRVTYTVPIHALPSQGVGN